MENNINVNTGNQININLDNNNGKLLSKNGGFEINDSAKACIAFIAFNILFSIVISFLGISTSGLAERNFFLYTILSVLIEGMFAFAALVVCGKRDIVKNTGMNKKVNSNIVGICFLISLISLLGFSNITNVFVKILYYFGYSSVLPSMEINTFGKYIGYLVSSCLVAGFCEELLFRGVIESGLKKWGIKVAVGFSALIFMLMHGNAEQTVHQFIIGVIIGYVFYKTNNLWLGVLIHTFNNFVPVTLSYLLAILPSTETATETVTTIGLGTILVNLIVAIIVASAGIYLLKILLRKLLKENENVNGKLEEEKTNENLVVVKVDGSEETVEVNIDNGKSENSNGETLKEKPNVPGIAIFMFTLSGLYLVGEWILALLIGFLNWHI